MKTNYLILFFLFIYLSINAQNKKLQKLDITQLETSVLIPTSIIFNIDDFQNNTNSVYSFKQAFKIISQNDFESRFNNLNLLNSKNLVLEKIIPLAVLHSDYSTIVPEAFTDGRLTVDADQNLFFLKIKFLILQVKRFQKLKLILEITLDIKQYLSTHQFQYLILKLETKR